MKELRNIKALVWDIDGTLYKDIAELKKLLKEDTLQMIQQYKKVNREEAAKIFKEGYQKLSSSTKVLLLKLGFSWKEVKARSRRFYEYKTQFLKKDPQLVAMFGKLKRFRHLIASNNTLETSKKIIKLLGLKPQIFEKFFGITPEIIKPDPVFFQRILDYTGLPANQHIFIGDREKTEIIPARKIGMKTCFVWGKSEISDVSLSTVYDILYII